MIEMPTVFVLGAGASYSYGYPTGQQLLASLETGAKYSHPNYLPVAHYVDDLRYRLRVARADSIDDFLKSNPDLVDLGKLCIAHELLKFEKEEVRLREGSTDDWLRELWSCLRAPPSDFSKNKVSIINYNYDRLIEHYLTTAMQAYYPGTTYESAWKAVQSLNIIHPHGVLGRYDPPSRNPGAGRRYGVNNGLTCEQICQGSLQLFWENHKGRPEIMGQMEAALTAARRIVFLGFGYLRTNMQDLAPLLDKCSFGHQAYGTAFRLGKTRAQMLRETIFGYAPNNLVDCQCLELLRDHVQLV